MSGHTKGPWEYHRGQITHAAGFVGSVYTGKNRVPNGRLIAAAPDLLGALWSLMAAYAACNGEDHPAYIHAEKVIRAAEGRS